MHSNEQKRRRSASGAEICSGPKYGSASPSSEASSVSGGSASTSAEAAEESVNADDLRFSALRNALYHTARLQHYSRIHRWIMFFVIALSMAGIAKVAENWVGSQWIGAITALLAAVDLVLDLRGKTELHNTLRNKYYLLLADVEKCPKPTVGDVCEWKSKLHLLAAEEPGEFRGVDAIAFNEAVDALGRDDNHKLVIPKYISVLAHLHPFRGVSFAYKNMPPHLG